MPMSKPRGSEHTRPYVPPSVVEQIRERRRHALIWLLSLTLACQALFASMPWIDPWVSGIFGSAEQGFPIAQGTGFLIYREFLNHLFTALGLLALFGVLLAAIGRKLFALPQQVWVFIVGVYLLGPAVLVNGILKANWGRARPVHTVEFGGDRLFSPPFEIASQCVSNCSFVSGEAAAATAFAISAFVLTRFLASRVWRNGLFGAALSFAVSGALLRVAFGRHFLSDVIFSALFVSLIAVALSFIFVRRKDRVTGDASRDVSTRLQRAG